jgi:hypothetical protein
MAMELHLRPHFVTAAIDFTLSCKASAVMGRLRESLVAFRNYTNSLIQGRNGVARAGRYRAIRRWMFFAVSFYAFQNSGVSRD